MHILVTKKTLKKTDTGSDFLFIFMLMFYAVTQRINIMYFMISTLNRCS